MAMLPFCGYHMGDYFEHWLAMGRRMAHPPKIFHVNWFRTDENGKFLWPGYGENLRVIEWILDRCRGEADARETPIGYVPTPESLDLTGLDIPRNRSTSCWPSARAIGRKRPNGSRRSSRRFGDRLPRLSRATRRLRQQLQPPRGLLAAGLGNPPPAAELNDVDRGENPHVYAMMSELGKRLYFPKGILAQTPRPRRRPSATTPRSASPGKTASRCSCRR